MAGRSGTVQGLIFGLVLVALGLVALAEASNAEPWGERRARTAQGAPPVFLPPAQQRLQARPARAGSSPTEAPTPEQVEAIARVQACLAELGYYKGDIDGKRGRETWTAYWHFKHDHGLGAYSDILAEPVRQKLNSLCKLTEETAAVEPTAQPLDQPGVEGVLASPEP